MIWLEFDPRTDGFIDQVQGLWEFTWYPTLSRTDSSLCGAYQVVKFFGDAGYYVRKALENDDYTLAGCFPGPHDTLAKAKLAVKMLTAMGVN